MTPTRKKNFDMENSKISQEEKDNQVILDYQLYCDDLIRILNVCKFLESATIHKMNQSIINEMKDVIWNFVLSSNKQLLNVQNGRIRLNFFNSNQTNEL